MGRWRSRRRNRIRSGATPDHAGEYDDGDDDDDDDDVGDDGDGEGDDDEADDADDADENDDYDDEMRARAIVISCARGRNQRFESACVKKERQTTSPPSDSRRSSGAG